MLLGGWAGVGTLLDPQVEPLWWRRPSWRACWIAVCQCSCRQPGSPAPALLRYDALVPAARHCVLPRTVCHQGCADCIQRYMMIICIIMPI
jgi:hypothetical protein